MKITRQQLDKLYRTLKIWERPQSGSDSKDLADYARRRKDYEIARIDYLTSRHGWDFGKFSTDELYRAPLDVGDKGNRMNILLSWGGDEDGFILYHNRGYYYWADWGIYQEVPLTPTEYRKVWRFYVPEFYFWGSADDE